MRPTFVPRYIRSIVLSNLRNQRDIPQKTGNNVGIANYGVSEETSLDRGGRRKEEAIKFVENEMRTAAQAALDAELNLETNRGIEAVDDTDDIDPVAEKAAWKLRELQRLKRERESLIVRELEREELEKRRNIQRGCQTVKKAIHEVGEHPTCRGQPRWNDRGVQVARSRQLVYDSTAPPEPARVERHDWCTSAWSPHWKGVRG